MPMNHTHQTLKDESEKLSSQDKINYREEQSIACMVTDIPAKSRHSGMGELSSSCISKENVLLY